MFVVSQIKSFLNASHNYMVGRDAVLTASLLTNTIQRKSLRISNSARSQWPSARIINLVVVDSEAIVASLAFMHHAWAIALEGLLVVIFVYFALGTPVLGMLLTIACYIPINFLASKFIRYFQQRQMKHKDKRITFTKEVMHGIKVVKLYAWEEAVQKEIERLRKVETRCLRAATLISRILNSINASAPFLIAIVCFTWFVLSSPKNVLTPQIAFVGLSLFNLLRRPVVSIAPTIHFLTKAMVSMRRLNAFLSTEELPVSAIKRDKFHTDEYEATVFLENATFSWGNMKESLKEITMNVREGEFHCVCGPNASGKSTLLSAILGDLELLAGERVICGTTAYLPETPWIMNASIRANILYDLDLDKKHYDKCVLAADLRRDIFVLPRCDATVVGNDGLGLSGGQKARVALARALYQNCDIYLLDEPFCNLDAPVARTVFEKTLGRNGMLAKKTVILVTNHIHFTKYADCIHVMKDGRIVDSGRYEDLLERNEWFAEMKERREADEEIGKGLRAMSVKRKQKAVMFEPERPMDAKRKSLEPIKEGRASSSIWLSIWSDINAAADDAEERTKHTLHYMQIYITFGVLAIIFTMFAYISCTFASVRASIRLHKPMIIALLRAPIAFFDKTPTGRIFSRLTADLDTVDYSLAINVRLLVDTLMNIAMVLVIVCFAAPLLLIFSVPFAVLYFFLLRFFIPSARQIRRLECQQRSRLLSVLSQNMSGASSIRAYQRLKNTVITFCDEVDAYVRCRILQPASYRWLTTRLELLGNLLVLICVAMAAYFNSKGYLTAGEVGLCAAYLLSLTDLMNFSVRILGQTEANIVAVERIKEYHELPQEDEWSSDYPLIDAWPHSGEIEIKKYDIEVRIKKGEKVALIGRTGAGKSTLINSLLRLVKRESGDIYIDGVNIAELGLHELRTRISVVPQEPILFSTTLRFNLDPFCQFADSDLWLALEACQLKELVSSHSSGLLMTIEEGGRGLSIGQRQLICICRALLKGGQILILDEATASVDSKAEHVVQQVIREHFKQATVILISHKLHNINACDNYELRIIVMENGEVVDVDTPTALLERESLYRQMVEQHFTDK